MRVNVELVDDSNAEQILTFSLANVWESSQLSHVLYKHLNDSNHLLLFFVNFA